MMQLHKSPCKVQADTRTLYRNLRLTQLLSITVSRVALLVESVEDMIYLRLIESAAVVLNTNGLGILFLCQHHFYTSALHSIFVRIGAEVIDYLLKVHRINPCLEALHI